MTLSDTSEESARIVTGIYRKMPPERKLLLVFAACRMGQQLALAGLRLRYPDADERTIWHLWAKQYLGETLYRQVYGDRQIKDKH